MPIFALYTLQLEDVLLLLHHVLPASLQLTNAGTAHHSPDHSDAHTHLSRHQPNSPSHSATPSATDPNPGQQPASDQPDDPAHLTAPQAQPHDSTGESTAASHVPPELRAVTAYLRDKGRLRTPGLFVNSADAAMLWAMHQPAEVGTPDNNREPKSGCALAVRQVREALDRGKEVHKHIYFYCHIYSIRHMCSYCHIYSYRHMYSYRHSAWLYCSQIHVRLIKHYQSIQHVLPGEYGVSFLRPIVCLFWHLLHGQWHASLTTFIVRVHDQE